MASYQELFNLHVKYVEYLLAKSYFSNQYVKNISQSGSEVEEEIRVLLQSIMPRRFRITHGYIVYAHNKQVEPKISPQIDLIIVDTLVPHSIFTIDKDSGMEIVPLESVVGIFEIKRTLNKGTFEAAIQHLSKILTTVDVTKSDTRKFLPGGVQLESTTTIEFTGGYHSNPMVGILAADHDKEISLSSLEIADNKTRWLDVVISFQGLIYALKIAQNQNLHGVTCRKPNEQYDYAQLVKDQSRSAAKIIAVGLGYLLAYVQGSRGRQVVADNYFLNDKIQ